MTNNPSLPHSPLPTPHSLLPIPSPFNAPIYHEKAVNSTMEVSRELARQGAMHGTVIVADFQRAGRGRIPQRLWDMESEAGLPFTVLLRYPRVEEIPAALTLRAGLAVSLAIEDFVPSLAGRVFIKWPNDIMLVCAGGKAKKAAGILAEADGGDVHLGIGVNVGQRDFPAHLRDKATSIYLAGKVPDGGRFALLERILARLHDELTSDSWKNRIEARLYKKGELVSFANNKADSGEIVSGTLAGIGQGGELLIAVPCGPDGECEMRSFIVGELLFDDYQRI